MSAVTSLARASLTKRSLLPDPMKIAFTVLPVDQIKFLSLEETLEVGHEASHHFECSPIFAKLPNQPAGTHQPFSNISSCFLDCSPTRCAVGDFRIVWPYLLMLSLDRGTCTPPSDFHMTCYESKPRSSTRHWESTYCPSRNSCLRSWFSSQVKLHGVGDKC